MIKYFNRCMIILGIIFMFNYFRWRLLYLIHNFSYIGLIYSISEITIMLFGILNTYFISWNMFINYDKQIELNSIRVLPTIDIYLLTCKEPLNILQKSIEKILKIDYPIDKLKIFISDDGYSNELRNYVEIIKEENLLIDIRYKNRIRIAGHSKAGNINDTLFHTNSNNDMILILDSDMECNPNILKTLIPYFYDNENKIIDKMSFVQSPQSFNNISKMDILGQQYKYFYQIIMKSWNFWGCVPCCGTNVLFNKTILKEIGGFQYGSVTEDFLTSMILHSKGYKSKYCHIPLAIGLAPYTIDDFYKQRFRWSIGGVQLLKFLPKVIGKLSISKLWIYFNSSLFILLTPLLIILILTLLLIFYIPVPIFGDIWYLYYFGAFTIVHFIILLLLYSPISYLYLLRSFQESIYMINCHTVVLLYTILCIPYSFTITPKNKISKIIPNLLWCLPYLIYYSLGIYTLCTNEIKIIQLIWLSIIFIQMFPPINYLISDLLKKLFYKN